MDEDVKPPNRARLWTIALGSLVIGSLAGFIFYAQITRDGYEIGWVFWLIILMLSVIIYSITFYFGHRFLEDSLDQYIVSDTFSKKHDWIDLETETRESGDTGIDGWVAHYKFIRTMFAMGLLPVLACIYLFWFA